jgi:hypothetical protein
VIGLGRGGWREELQAIAGKRPLFHLFIVEIEIYQKFSHLFQAPDGRGEEAEAANTHHLIAAAASCPCHAHPH